jgi:hypothetical protein
MSITSFFMKPPHYKNVHHYFCLNLLQENRRLNLCLEILVYADHSGRAVRAGNVFARSGT